MGGRVALLLSILSCLLSVPVPASRPTPSSNESLPRLEPIPESFFGMHIIIDNWPTVSFSDVRSTGVSWRKLEPSRGEFDWSPLDFQVSRALARGKKFYYSTGGVPKWWAGTSNIQDFDDFVIALATRYKGKIEAYELWNEPDQDEFVSRSPMSDIVLITKHMHDDIRRIDPAALIASPAVVRISWMDGYWNAGGVRDIDVVALHGYPRQNQAEPEIIGSQKALPMRSIMAKYGLSSKPLWDSEASWGDSSYGIVDPEQQAGFIARFYLLHWSYGFSRYYWYSWDDNGDGPGGVGWGTLFNPKTKIALPGARAYQQVHNWMVGATMSTPCSMLADSTWTCTLTRPGGYRAIAVWNSSTSKSYTPADGYKQYVDLSGINHTVQGPVAIGYNPILLVNSVAPAS
jgi:hypothetical protein